MAVETSYGQATHTRRYAVSVIDALAAALGTRGALPPPIGEITCEVVRQTAPVARTFVPPLVLWTLRNPSGFVILDGTAAPPQAPRRPLSPGTYELRIAGPFYQDLVLPIDWPPANDSVRVPADRQLLPGPAYPFPAVTPTVLSSGRPSPHSRGLTLIRGTVLSAAGEGIAGATAELINVVFTPHASTPTPLRPWPFLRCVTSASGDWAIPLPDRLQFKNVDPLTMAPVTHDVTIRLTRPGAASVDIPATVPLGTEFALPQTALRGHALRRGRPVSDARITTTASAAASRVRADGSWRFYFPPDQPDVASVNVTVTTLSGETRSASTPIVRNRTLVVPTFEFA